MLKRACSLRPTMWFVRRSASRVAARRCSSGCSSIAAKRCPEAVFGCNDAIAFGCIEVLRVCGLSVPDDVSVVGYDNTLMARSVHMTTVRQPLHDMGRLAVEILVQRVQALKQGEPYPGPFNIVLPTEIIPGATLSAPRPTPLIVG